jgi:hypothetical protein
VTTAKPISARPAYYAHLYIGLVEVARKLGYALLIHGSMARDLDLVAVPWEEDCAEPQTLADAVLITSGGIIQTDGNGQEWSRYSEVNRNPTYRPHGRVCFVIQLAGASYIDLSIIAPRRRGKKADE